MSAATKVERMWLLNCGWIAVDTSLMMYRRSFGKKLIVPVSAALVQTSEGYFLFDTGLNPEAVTQAPDVLGPKAQTLVGLDRGHDVRTHLETLGVDATAVRWMANSHLHWDHTGANRYFPATEVLIQREELRFAQDPDAFVAQIFLESQFGLPDKPTVLDGDHVVVDGLGLINTRGHTPGHQSLLVRLPSGRIVLCAGDAAYLPDNIGEQTWPPGNPWDMPEAYRALRRMSFLRDFAGAEVVIGHDPGSWDRGGERMRELT